MPYAHNNQISQEPIPGGIEITEAQYKDAIEGMTQGKVVSIDGGFSVSLPVKEEPEPEPPHIPTTQEKQAALEFMIQQRLDTFARSVNFDNLASACLTGLQPVGTYRQVEGAEFITLRYTTWQKAAEIRDAFLAGDRPEPTWEEVEAELPTYPIVE